MRRRESQCGQALEVIRGVALVRPETGEVFEDVDLRLANGRVLDVTPTRPGRPFGVGGGTLDGSGLFAMAGLIDTHVHAMGPQIGETPGLRDVPWVLRQQARNLAAYLRAGVTTVRDMAAPLKLIRWWSRRVARGEVVAPRLLYAGPMLTVPGGYPHFVEPEAAVLRLALGPLRVDLRSASEARRTVAMLKRAGTHCVKVAYQSAQYDDARTPLATLSPGLLCALGDAARAHGLPLAMHEVYLEDLRALLDAPFDSLEHTPIDAELSDADVAALLRRPLTVATTFSAYGPLDHVEDFARVVADEPERFEAKPRRYLPTLLAELRRADGLGGFVGRDNLLTGATHMRRNVRKLAAAGARVVFASDSGLGPGLPGCPSWELWQMKQAGFSNREVLRAATVDAAAGLARPDLGRLEPGTRADVVLMRGNPLEDLGAVGQIAAVVRGGRLLHEGREWARDRRLAA